MPLNYDPTCWEIGWSESFSQVLRSDKLCAFSSRKIWACSWRCFDRTIFFSTSGNTSTWPGTDHTTIQLQWKFPFWDSFNPNNPTLEFTRPFAGPRVRSDVSLITLRLRTLFKIEDLSIPKVPISGKMIGRVGWKDWMMITFQIQVGWMKRWEQEEKDDGSWCFLIATWLFSRGI